jgi:hypothetical protein
MPVLILMSVCLLSSPANCHEERLNFAYENVSAMACMVRSQSAIAEWQEGHPDWHVTRWRCAAPGTIAVPI